MFRKDLFYRISVAGHILPPLREIRGDIPLLADHFREVFNREFRKDVESIAEDAIEVLKNWDWPGNVRELRNVIERALIFAKGPRLARGDLPDLGTLEAPGAPPRPSGDNVPTPRRSTSASRWSSARAACRWRRMRWESPARTCGRSARSTGCWSSRSDNPEFTSMGRPEHTDRSHNLPPQRSFGLLSATRFPPPTAPVWASSTISPFPNGDIHRYQTVTRNACRLPPRLI
jgi:hypothetical protein